MHLAYCKGAKTIILWGVQFQNHHIYSTQNPHTKEETRKYFGFAKLLEEAGTKVYLGCGPSALEEQIPIYKPEEIKAN